MTNKKNTRLIWGVVMVFFGIAFAKELPFVSQQDGIASTMPGFGIMVVVVLGITYFVRRNRNNTTRR